MLFVDKILYKSRFKPTKYPQIKMGWHPKHRSRSFKRYRPYLKTKQICTVKAVSIKKRRNTSAFCIYAFGIAIGVLLRVMRPQLAEIV